MSCCNMHSALARCLKESGVLKMNEELRGEYRSVIRETPFLFNAGLRHQHSGVLQVLKLVLVYLVYFLFTVFEKHHKIN